MKLQQLRLENFRQYRGEQEILFATDKSKNVTLIWGSNGAGKTTLLNAFTWVLYGTFTEDFENKSTLYNRDAWNRLGVGSRMTVSVELEFENSGQVFLVRRQSRFVKAQSGAATCELDGDVTLTFRDQTGRSQKSGNPSDHIKQILPERLHNFFFFNGENIEDLMKANAYEKIEDAIKTILGLAIVERSIRHLPTAIKRFEDELRKHGTDEQREAATELSDLDREIERVNQKLAESRRAETQWQDELSELDEKLRGSEQSRELQRRRDDLVREEQKRSAEIGQFGDRIDRLIRERGFLSAGADLFGSIRRQFVDKRERKELPAPVKIEFIEDLLEDGTCICGASLADGTTGHKHISDWKQRAGLAEVEERWISLHASAGHMERERADLGGQLQELLDARLKAVQERDFAREQLSEVSSQLQSHSLEEISQLEDARVKISNHRSEELRQQGRLDAELSRLNESRRQAQLRLEKAQSVEAKAALAHRRVTATREALQLLETILEVRTQHTRASLDQEIKRIYQSISYKSAVPELNQEFQLKLFHSGSTEPAAKSRGENQILSLSFVGALASIARARFEETSKEASSGVRGGIYPIVMDAAFGTLDVSYRRDISLGLPALAEQVVVIISKAHGEGVLEHLSARIGRSYVINYTTSKADAKTEEIVLSGETFPYIQPSADGSEFAELIEVS